MKPESKTRYAGEIAGQHFAVKTLVGGGRGPHRYRRTPCEQCPWVKGRAGQFPADAYRHSARTSEDMAVSTFACHMSGDQRAADCAGFLLRGGTHNLTVRLKARECGGFRDVHADGLDLYDNYRAMAVANGVPADDPALARCRDDQ